MRFKMLPSLAGRFLPVQMIGLPRMQKWTTLFGSVCHLHTSSPQCFHFMKKQVTIDPEIAKIREQRKKKKLLRAIKMLSQYTKKAKPIEEVQLDVSHRETLEQRNREENREEGRDEMKEMYRNKKIRKQYGQSRARLARIDIQWIKQSTEAQQKALEVLKQLSPDLYEAAVQLDMGLIYTQIQGPPISQAIDEYKCPDGEYQDVSKKWEQPALVELEKKFGVGQLYKMPEFKKKQLQMQRQKAEEAEEKIAKMEPWMKGESRAVVEDEVEADVVKA